MHHINMPVLHKRKLFLAVLAALAASVATPSFAADKVKVGVFPSSSALPYFVALERGYFKEVDIETEAATFNAHPLTVQAIVTGDIEFAAGGALSNKFMTERPQLAARFDSTWAKAVNDVARYAKVRELLPKYMNTSADIAPTVPLAKLVLVKDLTAL